MLERCTGRQLKELLALGSPGSLRRGFTTWLRQSDRDAAQMGAVDGSMFGGGAARRGCIGRT
ncbi:MAG: hypothetical protein ABSF64_19835 [Bryobacteraceae bacterium]